jgi:S1-C subfamily serine protease
MAAMKKAALYSPSSRQRLNAAPDAAIPPSSDASESGPSAAPPRPGRAARRRPAWLGWALVGLLGMGLGSFLALGPAAVHDWAMGRSAPAFNMRAVEAALRKSLEEKPLVPASVKAAQAIAPSVVRVMGLMRDDDDGSDASDALQASGRAKADKLERGIGSGVVIIDNGTILTNLHVLQGAKRIKVTFADGHVSDARMVSVDARNDLAVLRAQSVPDDLQAAAMRSTADLAPGEPVVAVGFPFGIGPSTSSGVVSGLKREFRSPDGQQVMTNLIQFDAAANPGNSGGPLVTLDGAVVGIVTAILNPTQQRVFIGIGFAVPIENAAGAAGMPPF